MNSKLTEFLTAAIVDLFGGIGVILWSHLYGGADLEWAINTFAIGIPFAWLIHGLGILFREKINNALHKFTK